MMSNNTFRGRGLTARFLYCMPESIVGERRYRTEAIPPEVKDRYSSLLHNLLGVQMKDNTPNIITLSPKADELLESFSNEVESKLKNEYSDIGDWAGKLVGTVLRIAGILYRASTIREDFLGDDDEPLVVDEDTMKNAIAIGRYFTEHAISAFSTMCVDNITNQSKRVLTAIKKDSISEFTRRDIMRKCRFLKTADEVQIVLNHLTDYGYILAKETVVTNTKGRTPNQTYIVNPYI